MRIKVSFYFPDGGFSYPNKHAVQGFIYNMLKGTEYGENHDASRFKFFTFSDVFIDSLGRPTFLVSSPDEGFIRALHSSLKDRVRVYIGTQELIIDELKKFRLPLKKRFQTGSPVVLYRDSRKNEYFKLHSHRDLNFFLRRLKENAEKKYNAFYGDEFTLEGPIFDRMIPKLRKNGKLDVYVKVVKQGVLFPVIGSNWELLEKERIKSEERRFYRFIMETGLGEKNSLGFGFLNPIRG
ncbi:CRISPR-associated endoribonuclease Cas6 [Thermococcus piezophilus]|uniref:CRISPR-associated endoribonuclease Cas6 n=1 Tax=Thermococcus piezophilus TaxID=1712654 RepID=A0A172WEE1_9EURY|nr:CRISPR-associated endoribonuclease Cas6 [Thermococcus piezophilus]ANF21771.1 CRISPR-associated endoribonuclease Cas6 [Thermococcus piezophilus]